jgi:predicted Rossmann fold nucleotide-binding protein DprA/Smf involved in DNA uptake
VLLYVRGDPEVLTPLPQHCGYQTPRRSFPESLRKKPYELLSSDESAHIDDIVERSGLNSSEVLATLFNLEMKGIVPQSPGKQFSKVLF